MNKRHHGRLIVICGLPGSGKTTLSRQIATTTGALRMCPDEWMERLGVDIFDSTFRERLEALQWDLSKQLLMQGDVVVIEWGTWAREERDALRVGARELDVAVELCYLEVSPEVLWQRIGSRRMEQHLGSRAIERTDLDQWLQVFQAPTSEELALFDPPRAR